MNDPQIHKILSDIEKKSENDFDMLEECGAEFFSTSDLLEMRGKWKEQMRMFTLLHQANIYVAASAPIWLLLASICGLTGLERGVLVCLTLFPLSLFTFIGVAVFLRQTYRGKGWLDFVGREIESELAQRKNETKKQKRG